MLMYLDTVHRIARAMRTVTAVAGIAMLLSLGAVSWTHAQTSTSSNIASSAAVHSHGNGWCTLETAPEVSTDGIVRLALIVGVGTFRNRGIDKLLAPADDAAAMADLIAAPTGYRFPKQNVCVLSEQQATRSAFLSYFQRALSERAREVSGKHPVQVLVYFSGHGSYAADHSGDETDGKDELLILHDSWADGVSPLRDDEFNAMIAKVHAVTRDIVVIIDACHSGSATKGPSMQDAVEKMTPPQQGAVSGDDTGPELESLPGVTRLSAARDGTSALAPREGGKSYFTAALQNVLAQVESEPLSWEQVSRRTRVEVSEATLGRQLPVFQGELSNLVFSNKDRIRPYGWLVESLDGERLHLRGVPLPGWSQSAELRIYDGNADRRAVSDPKGAKAVARIEDFHGLTATARVFGTPRSKIQPGDICVLSIPGQDGLRLPVRVSAAVPGKLAAEIDALLKSSEFRDFMVLSEASGAFVVEFDPPAKLAIRGPEGVVRGSDIALSADLVLQKLKSFARQQIVLAMEGEPGASMRNDDTLRVRVVQLPPAVDSTCPHRERAVHQWVEQCPNQEQLLPVCAHWRVEVANMGTRPLRIGGALLLNDGQIMGLPFDSENVVLQPDGKFYRLDDSGIESTPPMNVQEYLVIFGTDPAVDIDWGLLSDPGSVLKGSEHPLAKSLRGLLTEGVKGGARHTSNRTSPWTSTKVTLRVLANPQLEASDIDARSCELPAVEENRLQQSSRSMRHE